MKKMFHKINQKMIAKSVALSTAVTSVMASSALATDTVDHGVNLDAAVVPIVGLINSLMGPALALVGALGSLYCVLLGVKFAKAEEPQEREKAKTHLKNAIIGFVLIFVLILALNLSKDPLITWMEKNHVNVT